MSLRPITGAAASRCCRSEADGSLGRGKRHRTCDQGRLLRRERPRPICACRRRARGVPHGRLSIIRAASSFGNDAMQDRIFVWRLDTAPRQSLFPNDPPYFEVARGTASRAISHSRLTTAIFYNLNERGQTIDTFEMALVGGNARLRPIASVPTLPPGTMQVAMPLRKCWSRGMGGMHMPQTASHDTIAMFQCFGRTGVWRSLGEIPTQAVLSAQPGLRSRRSFGLFAQPARATKSRRSGSSKSRAACAFTGHTILDPQPQPRWRSRLRQRKPILWRHPRAGRTAG